MMLKTEVWLNNVLADLTPDTVITKTFQCFDLFNLGAVQANYTNQFKLPFTPTNDRIFSNAREIKYVSGIPYSLIDVRLIMNGNPIVKAGYAVLTQSDTYYNITIFDGNYNFWTLIQGLDMDQINLLAYNMNWNSAGQKAVCNANTGIVSPLVNYGNLTAAAPGFTEIIIDPTKNYPSIYLATLLTELFATFGFGISGSILTDTRFTKMIVLLANMYNANFTSAKEFRASAPGTQTMSSPSSVKVTFNQVSLNGADNFYDGTNTYRPVNPSGSTNPWYVANFAASLNITVTGGTVNIEVHHGAVVYASQTLSNKGTGIYTISSPTNDMDKSDGYGNSISGGLTYYVTITTNSGAPNVTINAGEFWNKCPSNEPNQNWFGADVSSNYVSMQYLLPDLSISDFLKFVSLMFGQLYNQVDGTIKMRGIEEIINDQTNAVDWTSKRNTDTKDTMAYQFGNFAQKNTFKWDNKADDSINADYVKGSFAVPNVNLSATEKVTTAPFSASQSLPAVGMSLLSVPVWDAVGSVFINPVGPRIAYVRDKTASEYNNNYGSAGAPFPAGNKIAYFIDGTQTNQMKWQTFLDTYYPSYIKALQKAKAITRKYMLTDADINQFDPFRLIFDDGVYYIVNKITNYIPGKLTQVELFKVS
jgi:hypothetical protein